MNTAFGNLVWFYNIKCLPEFNHEVGNWEGVLLIRKAPSYFDFMTNGQEIITIGDHENAVDTMTDEEVKDLPNEYSSIDWRLPINEAAGFDITGFIRSLASAWPGEYRVFNYDDTMENGIIIGFCLNDPIRDREGLRRAIAHKLNVWATNL
ncbi:MAG: hypothetical protein WCP93_03240 [Candidatus Berkelbacteria bacterium]